MSVLLRVLKKALQPGFFSQWTSIQFGKHRPLSLRVVSQTPLLSAYRAKTNSSKPHGFSSSTNLALHPAERRDVMLFYVDFGLVLALLMTLNQTESPLINFMEAISVAQACRVTELAFMGFPSSSSGMS